MSRPIRILMLEDRQDVALLMLDALRRAGFEPDWRRVGDEAELLAHLDPTPDLILANDHLPRIDGLRALHLLRDRGLDVPIVVVSGASGHEAAIGQAVADALQQKQDRDEKSRAEAALHAGQARKAAIVDAAPDGIVILGPRGQILDFNPAAEVIFGCTRAEAVGRPLVELIIPPAGRETWRQALACHLATRPGAVPGRRVEMTALRADGTGFPAELTVTHLREEAGGGPPPVAVFIRDVTARRRAEDELRAAKEAAEAAGRAKDQFLAVLSHELRNPLAPVLMAVSAMEVEPPTAEELGPTLAMIRQNVELEARLIDDLLDLSRISHGKLHLNRERVDVHAVIRRALETCRDAIQAGRLQLVLDLSAASCHAEADPARLQQVFWNLIKNAVKFTPAGGTIAIRSRTQPGSGPDARRLIVDVSDTGIGIEPDSLPTIFRAFEQVDSARPRHFGGLGLGLAISRSVAEAHGGSLVAASAGPGRGATFTFSLSTAADRPPGLRSPPPNPVEVARPSPVAARSA